MCTTAQLSGSSAIHFMISPWFGHTDHWPRCYSQIEQLIWYWLWLDLRQFSILPQLNCVKITFKRPWGDSQLPAGLAILCVPGVGWQLAPWIKVLQWHAGANDLWALALKLKKISPALQPNSERFQQGSRTVPFFSGRAFSCHQSPAPEIETQQICCWEHVGNDVICF